MPKQSFNFSLFLFNYYAYAGTFVTYISLFFAARGMTVPQIGILVSLVQVMRIVGPNVWGWVGDHTRQRVLVLRLTAVAALLSFCCLFLADSFAAFFIVMVMLNLFTSAQAPLSEALMLSEMRGDISNYGRIRLWGSIGFIVSVMASGYLLEWFGVSALLWIGSAMLLCVIGASLRIREIIHPPEAHGRPRLLNLLKQPEVATFFLSAACMCGAHMALYVFYSLYLERAGYSKPVIGVMWALGVVAEVAFFYFQAQVFARFGARRVMMVSFAVAVLRFLMIGAGAGWLWLLVVAQLMHAATFAAHHSAFVTTMQRWFSGPLQASGQALLISIGYGVGGTIGGLFLSFCWDSISPEAIYFAAAGMTALGAAAAAYSYRLQEKV